MFKSYFKTAWRNVLGNKLYSAITVGGLALGLAVGLLVLLWVQDETSFDRFHQDIAQIYRVGIDGGGTGEKKQIFDQVIAPVAAFAKREIPDVVDAVRIIGSGQGPLFSYADKKFAEDYQVAFTDPSFFSMFDFHLLKGDAANPFPDNNSIIVTESTAKKYFDDEEPLGKVIMTNSHHPYKVTGVIADFPSNSSIHYHILLPISLYNRLNYIDQERKYNGTGRMSSMDADWIVFNTITYLRLKAGANIEWLKQQLRAIHERNKPDDAPVPYFLRPMADMHLTTVDGEDAGLATVKIFSVAGLLILVIACINYINLSTARAMARAREVSMRKISGANRLQLFFQFIVETAVLFLIATGVAVAIMYAVMAMYNRFSGKELSTVLSNSHVWLAIAITLLGTLATSGIYPALMLSSFKPLHALRGMSVARMSSTTFRKALVVAQFSFSFLLITGTLIINKQLHFIQQKNLGYNKENIFSARFPDLGTHYDAIKSDMLKQAGVLGVTRSSENIIDVSSWTGDVDYDNKPTNTTLYIHPLNIDEDFIPFYHIKMKEGSNFTGSVSDSAKFIVNETAVKQLRLIHPIGRRLRIQMTTGTISGVVQDFFFSSMKKKIEPSVFSYNPRGCDYLSVKAAPGNDQQAVAAARMVYKQYRGDLPFNFAFLDDTFDHLYKNEQRTASLFAVFAVVAVLVSCLGLFGLATHTAQVKTREIGIRKVLGASVSAIVGLLSKDFVVLVSTAIAIATPVSWFIMTRWLQDFAYRVNIPWTIFFASALLSLAIALITVSIRTVQAAIANPVTSIKSE